MDEQRQDDQLEPVHNSSVPLQDVAMKTYRERCMIEMGGGRKSGRSVLAVRHDDDDDDDRKLVWEESYPSAEMQSVYSTASADWTEVTLRKMWLILGLS